MTSFHRPWLRFTATPATSPREVDPRAPWPRWGAFAPRPTIEASRPVEPPQVQEWVTPEPDPVPPPPQPLPTPQPEPVTARVEATPPPTPATVDARMIRSGPSAALVAMRLPREVALVDVARAVKKASPAIAIASVAAVAAMAFFRRR